MAEERLLWGLLNNVEICHHNSSLNNAQINHKLLHYIDQTFYQVQWKYGKVNSGQHTKEHGVKEADRC
jgi:hypothetical protein